MADSPICVTSERSLAASHPGDAVLRAFAAGRLPEAEIDMIAHHLAGCGLCRDYVDQAPNDALAELARGAASGGPPRLRLQAGYEIMEVLGRGGMGVVYRARQFDLDRVVAFKQIEGDVSSEDLARFRAEASAMARLQHPNIVQVYDVGEQDERPYIACEFVPGGGLDRHLTGSPLPMLAACGLVATLARAVQAAHEQSVVHRDLKPSNVLLVPPNGPNVGPDDEHFWQLVTPKIADFGLAKLLDQDDGCTRTGALLGTPAYMAPEQTGGAHDEAGPRSDVYALGVILYETVTGRRPFQGSTVVETLDLVRAAAPVPLRRLRNGVPRDLEIICMKCLEKEPRRRYAAAAALADDLQRLSAGEPIRARPVPVAERCAKWLRRRPALAVLIVFGAMTIIAAVAGTFWHLHRLRAEVERASKSEAEAMLNFRHGYEALDQVIRELGRGSARSPAWQELNDRIWTTSLDFFYRVLKDADESNPEVRLAKGMLLSYAGSVHVIQGRVERGLDDLRQSSERLQWLAVRQPENVEVRYHLAHCYFWTGMAKYELGNAVEAEQFYRRAIDIESELSAAGANFDRLRHRLAQAHDGLARLYMETGRAEPAAQQYEAALKVRRAIASHAPLDNENRAKFGEAANQLAWLNLQKSQRERAGDYLREAVAVMVVDEGVPQSLWIKATLAETHRRWSLLEFEQGRLDKAVGQCDLAIAKLREIQLQDPLEPSAAILPATVRMKAWCLSRAGRTSEAFAVWSEAIEHAQGADREFYRSERALERALVGDHAAAATEALEIASAPDLPAHQQVHLARVYSRSIEAVDRDVRLSPTDAERLKRTYTAEAMACLRRVEAGWLSAPGRLAEMDSDVQLAAFRATTDYAEWRSTHDR